MTTPRRASQAAPPGAPPLRPEPRLHLLGPPAMHCADGPHRFLNERRFQLLAYLAFSGDWVERDHLATLLWPDHDASAARRNLRKIVFRARESAWSAGLEIRGECLRWPVATDVTAFKRALAAGRLAEACAEYRGPLLAGLDDSGDSGFSSWLQAHRASLHAQWRDAALAILPTLGDAAERAEAARRLVDDDPLDERALQASLAVLAADGKRVEAQALYRAYKHQLAEELGVEPSAALRAAAQSFSSHPARSQPPRGVARSMRLPHRATASSAAAASGWSCSGCCSGPSAGSSRSWVPAESARAALRVSSCLGWLRWRRAVCTGSHSKTCTPRPSCLRASRRCWAPA